MMTQREKDLVAKLSECWNDLCEISENEESKEGDIGEAAYHIHALQNMVLAQCAARFYPHKYRLMGGRVGK